MTLSTAVTYFSALFLAAILPGPAMITVISTRLTQNARTAIAASFDVAFGDGLVVALVLTSLVFLASKFGCLFATLKYIGAVYLVYLGIKLWRSGCVQSQSLSAVSTGFPRAFGIGFAVALGNPKAILLHGSLIPIVLDLGSLEPTDTLSILAIVFLVNICTMGSYVFLSGKAFHLIQIVPGARWINRTVAALIGGTGVFIAARS